MPDTTRPNTFLQRLVGAAALDIAIYEEVEADTTATSQAVTVVLVSSVAAGIGLAGASVALVAVFTLVALISWVVWAVLTHQIGTRLLPGPATQADVGQLLRTIGFASTPGVLRILAVLPGVAMPVMAITSLWMLAAMVVAVRQALDYEGTARAIAVCLIGWVINLFMLFALDQFFAPTTVQ